MIKECFDCRSVVNNPSDHAICACCGSYRVSGQPRTLWTSENERWTIELLKSGHIIVVDNKTCWNDNPMLYKGLLYWDSPYRVPKYVKIATGKFFTKASDKGR